MSLKVLVLTRYDRSGGSSRLRFLQYFPALAALGIEADAAPLLDRGYLANLYQGRRTSLPRFAAFYTERFRQLARAGRYDVVWIEKEALPWLPASMELAALRSAKVLIDFDDAWHLRYTESPNRVVRRMLGDKFERLARRADGVIVANGFLQDWARRAGARDVAAVPTPVDLTRYAVTPPPAGEPFTIGWIGTPESAKYLVTIKAALEQVLSTGRMKLLLIGPDRSILPLPNVEAHPWSEAEEGRLLQQIHVGVMPLPEGQWEAGKSAYKLLQYMAVGRPVIASPVGTNLDVIQDGSTGLFASRQVEWVAAFERLAGDAPLCRAMGEAARRTIEERFSLEATLPQVAAMIERVAAGKPNEESA